MLKKTFYNKMAILSALCGIIAVAFVVWAMWQDNNQGEIYNEFGIEYFYILQISAIVFFSTSIPIFFAISFFLTTLHIIFRFLNNH